MNLLNLIDQARRFVGPRGPSSSLQLHGQFGYSINGGEYLWGKNRIVNQGLNHFLNAAMMGTDILSAFYIVPFFGNVTPGAGVTAANFGTTLTEFVNYTQVSRPVWTPDGPSTAQLLENSLAPALFTVDVGAQNAIYGAGLVSVPTKGAGTGTLVAAALSPSAFTGLAAGFDVRIKYKLTGSSS